MGELLGADPDALDHLARALATTSGDLAATRKRLDRPVHSTPWNGREADRFRRNWDQQYGRAIVDAAAFLEEASGELRKQAEQQRRTSGDRPVTSRSPATESIDFSPCRQAAPGSGLAARMRSTRDEMKQRLQELRAQRARIKDSGLGGFFEDVKGAMPGQSERDRLDMEIRRLEMLLADPKRQFLKVDVSGDGRIIEVIGDLNDADNIAIHVPGMSTELETSYGSGPHEDAVHLHRAMNGVTPPGRKNVVITFLDYDPPDGGDLVNGAGSGSAKEGGRNLDALVDSLRADGFRSDQITPIGHSYGSTVIGHGISDFGLGVDRVGVVGSPGLGTGIHDAGMLGNVDIYAGRAQGVELLGAGDAVALAPFHGEDPTDEGFGAHVFSTGDAHGHAKYFVRDSASVNNLARIATRQEPE
jgi:hypothetical protein